ncbi:MAG: hypothetical protein CMM50_09945 [Rhodospirillaceae bacterium]|nr:hypothetical protein [Rhodospirillaceae bacterium]|tara:strand:- start:56 stop:637 length:582 start_codon:yes stop_codon:yes gene_type:complete
MNIDSQRQAAVDACLDKVRGEIAQDGVTRDALARVSKHLVNLASQAELFTESQFPPPSGGERSTVYRLSEDDDHSNALYVVSERSGVASPPHDHKTWAVIAGIKGEELNRLYDRLDDGSEDGKGEIKQRTEVVIQKGVGVAYMPEDIHSIHCFTEQPTVTLHLYGRAIDRQTDRIRFNTETGTTEYFTPNEIR